MRPAEHARHSWLVVLPVIVLGAAMAAAILITARSGLLMVGKYVPLQDASEAIESELALFHLDLERKFYLNSATPEGEVFLHLDNAEGYARHMLYGGRDAEAVYVPVEDPALRHEIGRMLEGITSLRQLARERLRTHSGESLRYELEIEKIIANADAQAGDVETRLKKNIREREGEYRWLTGVLLAACFAFTAAVSLTIHNYHRRRGAYISSLSESGSRLREKQEELTAALDRLRFLSAAVEEAPDVVQVVGLDGRIMYTNGAVERLYGYTPEELLGSHVNGMNADPSFAEEVILPSIARDGHWAGELMVKHKAGFVFPVWLIASMVRGADGKPAAMVGIVRDMTERRQAEREKDRLMKGISASSEGLALTDEHDRYIYVNDAHAAIYGYEREELAGKSYRDIVPPEALPLADKAMRELVHNREVGEFSGEVPGLRKDGSLVPTEVKAAGVWDEAGDYQGHICVVTDITKRKDLEQGKADFYAMITHDLKSPITSITGYAELILDSGAADNETRTMAAAIRQSGLKMMRLVEDFVAFGRDGNIKLNRAQTNVWEMLHDLSEEFAGQAAARNLSFNTDIPEDLPTARLDRKQVERAAANLVQNAVRYAPEGGAVTLSARPGDGDLVISVHNTGPGIPREEQDKIFMKYYRSSSAAGIKGTGLGLAIVKAVAEAHGGRAWVESEPGSGALFCMSLPVG